VVEKKRTELDDKRLTLCHAKDSGGKSITSKISTLLEEYNQISWEFISFIHPRFVITDFRW